MVVLDPHHGVVVIMTTRWLQQATGYGTGTGSEWFSWLLASVLGIVGVAASVVLVYVITLICDKGGRWFLPSRYANQNGVAATRTGTAAAPTQQQQYLGLDRNRLDIEDRKQIVKELFAKEIFLYGAASSSSVTTVTNGSAEDDFAEAGIQLRTMTTQETSESDDTPKKVQQKEVVQPASKNAALEGDGTNGKDKDKDLETGTIQQEGQVEATLGDDGQEGASTAFSSNECCICLAPYVEADVVLRSKHCPHMFHAACGENWMLLKPVCPLCTTPMILDAEWEATAISVLGKERYDALLDEQREGREPPSFVSSA
jgi:hypothetical protein